MTPRRANGRVRISDPVALRGRLWSKAHEQLRAAIRKMTADDRRTIREAARELRIVAQLVEELADLTEATQ